MTGALLQLAAPGIQDNYLTGDPQITFFKVLYRRHTNFSIESVPQNFSSPANFGETVSCILSRSGDLVGKIYLYVEIPAIPQFINPVTGEADMIKKMAWVTNLGYALIKDVSIEIGDKIIDKQYGEWMYIWSQVSQGNKHGLNKMIGNVPEMYQFTNGKQNYQLYIPLEFWFCKHNGLAIPLVSLLSTDIKITFTFRKLEECYRIGPTNSIDILEDIMPFQQGDYIEQTINNQTIFGYVIGFDYLKKKLYYIKIQNPNSVKKTFESNPDPTGSDNMPYRIYHSLTKMYVTPKPSTRESIEQTVLANKPSFIKSLLYINYIYLDSSERIKFVKTNHEYLIEQVQFNQEIDIKSPNVKQKLTLNHPCKSHYWVIQLNSLVGPNTINDLFNYTTSHIYDNSHNLYGDNILQNAKLVLNGRKRFSERGAEYFNLVNPYEHHTSGPMPGINVYSISINPEDYQPSSAINMSKINDINMVMRLKNIINPQNTVTIRSYTINYNILRICFNLAGMVFD